MDVTKPSSLQRATELCQQSLGAILLLERTVGRDLQELRALAKKQSKAYREYVLRSAHGADPLASDASDAIETAARRFSERLGDATDSMQMLVSALGAERCEAVKTAGETGYRITSHEQQTPFEDVERQFQASDASIAEVRVTDDILQGTVLKQLGELHALRRKIEHEETESPDATTLCMVEYHDLLASLADVVERAFSSFDPAKRVGMERHEFQEVINGI